MNSHQNVLFFKLRLGSSTQRTLHVVDAMLI